MSPSFLSFSCNAEYVFGVSLKDIDALSRAPIRVPSAEEETKKTKLSFMLAMSKKIFDERFEKMR